VRQEDRHIEVVVGKNVINTRKLLPDLTDEEESEYQRLIKEAKAAKEVDALPIRQAYLTTTVHRRAVERVGADASHEAIQQAIDAIDQQVLEDVLLGKLSRLPLDWMVELQGGDQISVEAIR
jgi:hypothetical protein